MSIAISAPLTPLTTQAKIGASRPLEDLVPPETCEGKDKALLILDDAKLLADTLEEPEPLLPSRSAPEVIVMTD